MDFSAFDEDEIVEETQSEAKLTSDKAHPQPKEDKTSRLMPMLKMSAIVAAFSIVSLIGGIVVGVSTAPKSDSSVKTVQGVKSQNSVLDNLDSVKDSQVKAMTAKVESLKQQVMKNGDSEQAKYTLTILSNQTADEPTVDAFLDQVMSLKNSASENELNLVRDAIVKMMTPESGITAAYDILKGPSASKQLGKSGKRGGASTLLLFNDKDSIRTYVVLTPFATEDKVTHQISVVRLKSNQIVSYSYVGLVDSVKPSTLEEALANDAAK